MNSLFRRIRQKLFKEGKLLRYLGYAVGEIALIIIGIMLALQLNNWNEDRKAQVEFDAYVVQLREDVELSLSVVTDRIEAAIFRKEEAQYVLSQVKDASVSAPQGIQFETALNGLGKFALGDISYGYLGNVLSGDLNALARDEDLTEQAMQFVKAVKSRMHFIEENSEIQRLSLETFVRYRGYSGFREDDLDVLYQFEKLQASDDFIYALKNLIYFLGAAENAYERIKLALESFLTVLEEYE